MIVSAAPGPDTPATPLPDVALPDVPDPPEATEAADVRRQSIEETRRRSAELFADFLDEGASAASREAARDALVRLHLPLVEHCARRFRNRGEPFEDLVQVGTIGLIKSVDRFDTGRGVEFSTYATPTIIGEIKRYFRDKGWAIRVPRRLQELRMQIGTATAELTQSLGRSPTAAELAGHIGCTVEEIVEGIESSNAYSTLSLDASDDSDDGAASIGLDPLRQPDGQIALAAGGRPCDERDRFAGYGVFKGFRRDHRPVDSRSGQHR